MHINKDYHNIVALNNNKVIFTSLDEDNSCNYYLYNITNNTTKLIGTINNSLFYNDSVTQIENNLYFYMSTGDYTHPSNCLFQLNLKNNDIIKLSSEYLDQTLVYVTSTKKKLISFKGKIEDSNSNTYITSYNLKTSEERVIVSTNVLYKKILNISYSNNFIYTLVSANSKFYIEKYNELGILIKSINIDNLNYLLDNHCVDNFSVIENYAFIRNYAGQGALIKINNNSVDIEITSNTEFEIAKNAEISNLKYYLFYQRQSNTILILDIKKGCIIQKSVILGNEKTTIKHICTDDYYNIIISMHTQRNKVDLFYLNYLELLSYANAYYLDDNNTLVLN